MVSGYTDGIGDLVIGDGQFTYMQKPFTPNALPAKERELLNEPVVVAKSARALREASPHTGADG